ncbi:MAG: TetR/AcrR family transcriptional regulator [bacterium]
MAMEQGGTRTRRRERMREQILETARHLLVEEGPERFSMRQLARTLDYSAPALYEYFPSKDALVGAVAEQGYARFAQHLLAVPQDLVPRDRLVGLGAAYLRFAREHKEEFLLIFNRLSGGTDGSWEEFLAEPGTFGVLLDAVKAHIREPGEASASPGSEARAGMLAFGYWCLVHGMAMLEVAAPQGIRPRLEAMEMEIIQSFTDQGGRAQGSERAAKEE